MGRAIPRISPSTGRRSRSRESLAQTHCAAGTSGAVRVPFPCRSRSGSGRGRNASPGVRPMKAYSRMVQLTNGLFVPRHVAQEVPLSPTVRVARNVRNVLAGYSILVTPGSGATVATHTVNSKEQQVVIIADDLGQIYGSRDTYCYNIASQVH